MRGRGRRRAAGRSLAGVLVWQDQKSSCSSFRASAITLRQSVGIGADVAVDVELAAEGALAAAWGGGWGGAGGGLLPASTGAAPDRLRDLAAGMGGLHAALEQPGSHRAAQQR